MPKLTPHPPGPRSRPRRVSRGVLVAAVLAAVPAALMAQAPDTMTVTGVVVDLISGDPVPGVLVSMLEEDWGVMTDQDGRFSLSGVPQTYTTLEFTALGYANLHLRDLFRAGMEPLRVEVQPQPVLLEGIRVMADRFERRRNAAPTTVRAYGRDELRYFSRDVLDFVRTHAMVPIVPCPRTALFAFNCVISRGRLVEPTVYIDEFRAMGGLDQLEAYPAHLIYLVEVYGSGRSIRVYTNQYMEHLGERPIFPIPLWW